jgi:hypothetical protein
MQSKNILIIMGVLMFLSSCSFQQDTTDEMVTSSMESGEQVALDQDYTDWTEETHSNDIDPDYDTVFPQDSVNRIDIVISESEWAAMSDDMEDLYGEFGGTAGSGQG